MYDKSNTITKTYMASVGETELLKCERAKNMVEKAIYASGLFTNQQRQNISIFAQGSYKNGTNIPNQSDVDIAVCYGGSFFVDYSLAPEFNNQIYGNIPAAYSYNQFHDDVYRALTSCFGENSIEVGDKSLKLTGNTYRIRADVVPCFELIQYLPNGTYLTGTRFISLQGAIITNWPQWHYFNGVQKNKETAYRFKKIVRYLKQINSLFPEDLKIPSFLIESLVWNVPSNFFFTPKIEETPFAILYTLDFMLKSKEHYQQLSEISGMKNLFNRSQLWLVQDARNFVYFSGKSLNLWK